MKRIIMAAILVGTLLSLPLVAAAASHQEPGSHDHEKAVETDHHGEMKHESHASHVEQVDVTSGGTMVIVGSMVSKGVKGMAHLNDVSATMEKMGLKTTHHFMIAFLDETTGEQIDTGTVALKITNPDAKVGETIELIAMEGHFGADVTLDMAGEYHFRLSTKLADGTKRKYHFHHVVK